MKLLLVLGTMLWHGGRCTIETPKVVLMFALSTGTIAEDLWNGLVIAFRNAFVASVSETQARFSVSGHFLDWQDLLNSDSNFREQNSMKPLAISLSLPPPLQSVLPCFSSFTCLKYKPISNYPPQSAVLLEALSQSISCSMPRNVS